MTVLGGSRFWRRTGAGQKSTALALLPTAMSAEDLAYLDYLRARFQLPLEYRQVGLPWRFGPGRFEPGRIGQKQAHIRRL